MQPLEELASHLVLLQQVPELTHCGLIGHRLASQVNTHEAAHRSRVVKRFFDRRIREVEPLLQEIDAQHPLQPDRRASVARLRIHRFDQRAQLAPWHHALHLGQKRCTTCRLRETFKSRRGQCHLLHGPSPCDAIPNSTYHRPIRRQLFQRFLSSLLGLTLACIMGKNTQPFVIPGT
jgi:hypothetical protein